MQPFSGMLQVCESLPKVGLLSGYRIEAMGFIQFIALLCGQTQTSAHLIVLFVGALLITNMSA
jgi:hypothetical protein